MFFLPEYEIDGDLLSTPDGIVSIPGNYAAHFNLVVYRSELFGRLVASMVSVKNANRYLTYLDLECPQQLERVFTNIECGFHFDNLLVFKQQNCIHSNQIEQAIEIPVVWQVQEILPAHVGFMVVANAENKLIEATYSLRGGRIS